MISTLELPADPSAITAAVPVPPSGFYAQHSLIRTAVPGSEPRWEMDGIYFQSRLCAAYHVIEIERCLDLDPANEPDVANPSVASCPTEEHFKPYRIEMAVENGPLRAESASWLADRLVLGLSQRLESVVWDPTTVPYPAAPDNTGLGALSAQTVPSGSSMMTMLGAVEDKILSAAAGAGTIHMAPSVAVQVMDGLREDNGIMRTIATGSKVVVGNYPALTMAAHVGNVEVYVGSTVYQDEVFDRATNKFWTRAWTDALVAFNTCAAWTYTVATP